MSKGEWARLRKQHQHHQIISSHSPSDDSEYHVHQSKNIISSKQQTHHTPLAASLPNSPATSFSPPLRSSMLQVDQGGIGAGNFLQILRRWKTKSAKPVPPRPLQRSIMSSSSTACCLLNLLPLSCTSFSSLQPDSDPEEADDDDNDCILVHQSRSEERPQLRQHEPTIKIIQRAGKERKPSYEGKVLAPARRTLSCPRLTSPLSSCTASPSVYRDGDEQEEEELEGLQLQQVETNGSRNLRRSISSSPLRSCTVNKPPSTPKGYLALYVGEERRRFLVKAHLINHPLFSVLLEKAKEEFGFEQEGPLNIPCDISFFQHIMFLVQSSTKSP